MIRIIRMLLYIAVVMTFFRPCPARGNDSPVIRIDPGGHQAVVWDVCFTKDDRYLVSAGEDKTVRMWDIESGRTVRKFLGQIGPGQEGKVYAMALSPADRWLAVGGWFHAGSDVYTGTGTIRLYDFDTGEIKALLSGHTNVVTALTFSSDSEFLASGGADRTVRVWRLGSLPVEVAVLSGHRDMVYSVDFSPDGKRLVSTGNDRTLRLWRIEDGSLIREMTGHQGPIWTAAYSPDGRYIVSGGYQDRTLKLWDGIDGVFIKDLAHLRQGPPGVCFSPDGKKIVAGAQEGRGDFTCPVIEVPSGRAANGFTGHHNSVKAVAVSKGGRLAATAGGNDNEIWVWELDTGRPLRKMVGRGGPVWSVGLSPDNGEIVWGNRYTTYDRRKFGPWEHVMRLKDGAEWDVSLGGDVSDESRYFGAIHRHGVYSLEAAQGGAMGWYAFLRILKDGRVYREIEWGPESGTEHRCFTFTSDGRTVISGGNNGVLTAYDVLTGKKVTDFVGHESEIWAVSVSKDGCFLVSGSADQTFRLWDLTGLDRRPVTYPLISFFVGADREWVGWTPKGYYTSSLKGDRYVGWHVNRGPAQAAEFYPAERFSAEFYRPDVVAAVLAAGDVEEGIRRAAKARKTEIEVNLERLLPPMAFFVQPDSNYLETSQPKIKIKARARAVTDEPVTDLKLLLDGRPVDDREVVLDTGENSLEIRLEKEVTLRPGKNTITLTAANRYARSNPETVTLVYTGRPETETLYKPVLYVLAVGVSRYKNSSIDLGLADMDANALAEILKGQEGRLYSRVEIKLLLNEQATRGNVLDGLDWLLAEATQKDVAILFLAGHGINDRRGGYYFLGHDVDLDRVRRSGVEWFHFQDMIEGMPSKILLLADTCHSGNITGSRRTRELGDMTSALKELAAAGTGVVVMTAATGGEASQESDEWGHGAFTKALIEGLEGKADYDGNGVVEIKEIDLYITSRVKALTRGAQHPTTEIPASLPNFPVAAY